MNPFLSRLHKELRMTRLTRRGANREVKEYTRFLHKEYARMPQIALPKPENIQVSLQEALENRFSALSKPAEGSLSLQEIGTVLGLSLGVRPNKTRNYPSGGKLYPIETYLIGKVLEADSPSAYHYNPTKHALERLWDLPTDFDMKDIAKKPAELYFPILIVFTSVWQRSAIKYGDLAYLHSLLEAGHMSENILLVSTALNLNSRPYAGFSDDEILKLLDLDEQSEQPIHSITLSKNSTSI